MAILKMIRLGIVGITGNNPSDKKKLQAFHMNWMMKTVKLYIKEILKVEPKNIILVSGGSAWCDHTAIKLYLENKYAGLDLYLVSKFNHKNKCYVNTHEGRKLNQLHLECQEKTNCDVLFELARAVTKKNTKIIIQRAFKPRNTLISKNCDYLMVFNFSDTIGGDKLNTWNLVKHDNKIIFDLNLANQYQNNIDLENQTL